jgi:hypothetical protein
VRGAYNESWRVRRSDHVGVKHVLCLLDGVTGTLGDERIGQRRRLGFGAEHILAVLVDVPALAFEGTHKPNGGLGDPDNSRVDVCVRGHAEAVSRLAMCQSNCVLYEGTSGAAGLDLGCEIAVTLFGGEALLR